MQYDPRALSHLNESEHCLYTFDGVVPRDPATPVRDSIMISFTQHNPSVCLSLDDVEALYALYPDCTRPRTAEPVCFKTKHNIGWVRLGVYILFPCMLALLLALLVGACTQKTQSKRLHSARNLLRTKSAQLGRAIHRLTVVQSDAERAREALDVQQATEESRVEARVGEEVAQIVDDIARASRASLAARQSMSTPDAGRPSQASSLYPGVNASSLYPGVNAGGTSTAPRLPPELQLQNRRSSSLQYLLSYVESTTGKLRGRFGRQGSPSVETHIRHNSCV